MEEKRIESIERQNMRLLALQGLPFRLNSLHRDRGRLQGKASDFFQDELEMTQGYEQEELWDKEKERQEEALLVQRKEAEQMREKNGEKKQNETDVLIRERYYENFLRSIKRDETRQQGDRAGRIAFIERLSAEKALHREMPMMRIKLPEFEGQKIVAGESGAFYRQSQEAFLREERIAQRSELTGADFAGNLGRQGKEKMSEGSSAERNLLHEYRSYNWEKLSNEIWRKENGANRRDYANLARVAKEGKTELGATKAYASKFEKIRMPEMMEQAAVGKSILISGGGGESGVRRFLQKAEEGQGRLNYAGGQIVHGEREHYQRPGIELLKNSAISQSGTLKAENLLGMKARELNGEQINIPKETQEVMRYRESINDRETLTKSEIIITGNEFVSRTEADPASLAESIARSIAEEIASSPSGYYQ